MQRLLSGRMKRLFRGAVIVGGLAAANAVIDSTRDCGCQPECWCQQAGLRHFRWVLPISHNSVTREWKQEMQSRSNKYE